jgi:hypothetical protein
MPEKMSKKEKVLGIITRRGAAGKTPLLQGSKASSDELRGIVAELEREGKIKSWPYRGRAGTMAIYTLPDAKDPRTKEMLEAKPPSKPEKKAAPAKIARAAVPPAKPSPSNGSGSIAAVIADLERRRTAALDTVERIDTAIETLRALA